MVTLQSTVPLAKTGHMAQRLGRGGGGRAVGMCGEQMWTAQQEWNLQMLHQPTAVANQKCVVWDTLAQLGLDRTTARNTRKGWN
jgi:hypothetical protein